MNPKQFQRRALVMVLLLALMLTGMGTTLYDLQINNGEEYARQAQNKIAEQETVEAARGQILDRNGQVLVSNKVVYQVSLDTSLMKEDRNRILLELMEIAREEGVEWTDNLPISDSAPFTFTTDNPYYTTSTDEEGNTVQSLTRLGRLRSTTGGSRTPPEPEEERTPPGPGRARPVGQDQGLLYRQGPVPGRRYAPGGKIPGPARRPGVLGRMCVAWDIRGEGPWMRRPGRTPPC